MDSWSWASLLVTGPINFGGSQMKLLGQESDPEPSRQRAGAQDSAHLRDAPASWAEPKRLSYHTPPEARLTLEGSHHQQILRVE